MRPARFRRSLAIALAGLLVLAGGVVAAVPDVRDAVLEFFGLQGATVERREELPPVPEPRPLGLGDRTTLVRRARCARDSSRSSRARRAGRTRSTSRRPEGLAGLPSPTGHARVGRHRPRAARRQFRGDIAPEYIGKIAGQATVIEQLRVDGERAIWMEGAPHVFFYRRPGRVVLATSDLRIARERAAARARPRC